jgi:hypothetical protein
MASASAASISRGFSSPGVHSITFKDDFCSFASEIREELLHYPKWKEMTQGGLLGGSVLAPDQQNGITTGHITESDRGSLPHSTRFSEFLLQNVAALCPLVGVDPIAVTYVEMNAMAYGAGSWLSPHTDASEYNNAEDRLVAWMLYLTSPEDGEWPTEKGGAVRVWNRSGNEQRVHPRFNRFAMFRVYDGSLHEIEKIAWQPEWPQCRLALSGWLKGLPVREVSRLTPMYLQSINAKKKNAGAEEVLQGSLALYNLLAKQRTFCGGTADRTRELIAELERDLQALRLAPPGTCFVRRVPGPEGCVIVVNESGAVVHFGKAEDYRLESVQRQEK